MEDILYFLRVSTLSCRQFCFLTTQCHQNVDLISPSCCWGLFWTTSRPETDTQQWIMIKIDTHSLWLLGHNPFCCFPTVYYWLLLKCSSTPVFQIDLTKTLWIQTYSLKKIPWYRNVSVLVLDGNPGTRVTGHPSPFSLVPGHFFFFFLAEFFFEKKISLFFPLFFRLSLSFSVHTVWVLLSINFTK